MRHSMAAERVNEVTESGLALVGEIRATSARRVQLERVNAGLEEADNIELERARSRVRRAKDELREACEDLDRIEEIGAQKAEIRTELLDLDRLDGLALDEASRAISINGKAAGHAYGREELLSEGALRRIVAARKATVPELSHSEVEAI